MIVRAILAIDKPKLKKQLQKIISQHDVILEIIQVKTQLLERISRESSDLIIISQSLIPEPFIYTINLLQQLPDSPGLVIISDRENPEEPLNPEYFMISTGISDNDYNNLVNILDNFNCKWIVIDIANGYISNLKEFCKKVRNAYPDKIIVAGNVSTNEGVIDLINCGVDIIKCGIGGGSACTTRIQTGIGMPQFSCILDCSDYTKSMRRLKEDKNENSLFVQTDYPHKKIESGYHYIISDGGITCPGDIAKAFGGGADFVMVGGEFAGHDENPGELIERDGIKYKFFYGMSSSYAMKNNYATNNNTNYRSSEGREIKVKYKGKLDNTVQNYLGGIRSTCTYTNSANIGDLERNCRFILVNNQYNNNLVNGK